MNAHCFVCMEPQDWPPEHEEDRELFVSARGCHMCDGLTEGGRSYPTPDQMLNAEFASAVADEVNDGRGWLEAYTDWWVRTYAWVGLDESGALPERILSRLRSAAVAEEAEWHRAVSERVGRRRRYRLPEATKRLSESFLHHLSWGWPDRQLGNMLAWLAESRTTRLSLARALHDLASEGRAFGSPCKRLTSSGYDTLLCLPGLDPVFVATSIWTRPSPDALGRRADAAEKIAVDSVIPLPSRVVVSILDPEVLPARGPSNESQGLMPGAGDRGWHWLSLTELSARLELAFELKRATSSEPQVTTAVVREFVDVLDATAAICAQAVETFTDSPIWFDEQEREGLSKVGLLTAATRLRASALMRDLQRECSERWGFGPVQEMGLETHTHVEALDHLGSDWATWTNGNGDFVAFRSGVATTRSGGQLGFLRYSSHFNDWVGWEVYGDRWRLLVRPDVRFLETKPTPKEQLKFVEDTRGAWFANKPALPGGARDPDARVQLVANGKLKRHKDGLFCVEYEVPGLSKLALASFAEVVSEWMGRATEADAAL